MKLRNTKISIQIDQFYYFIYHLLFSKMIANKGLSELGLSIPNFKASAYLLTYYLMLASDANTQLV